MGSLGISKPKELSCYIGVHGQNRGEEHGGSGFTECVGRWGLHSEPERWKSWGLKTSYTFKCNRGVQRSTYSISVLPFLSSISLQCSVLRLFLSAIWLYLGATQIPRHVPLFSILAASLPVGSFSRTSHRRMLTPAPRIHVAATI